VYITEGQNNSRRDVESLAKAPEFQPIFLDFNAKNALADQMRIGITT
jgi:hypothetical protein